MDPTAAWQTIVTGMQALACDPTDLHIREEVIWALQGLATWLDHGGAPTRSSPRHRPARRRPPRGLHRLATSRGPCPHAAAAAAGGPRSPVRLPQPSMEGAS